MTADGNAHLMRRRPAEVETPQARISPGEIVVVDRRVVPRDVETRAQTQDVAPGAVRPLTEQEVFSQIDLGAGIVVGADDLLERYLEQMAFGGKEAVVAGIVRQRRLEAVQDARAHDVQQVLRRAERRDDRIADLDVRAAIGDRSRQVRRELIAESDATAQSLLVPLAVIAAIKIAADAETDVAVEEIGIGEADAVAVDLGTGNGLQAEPLSGPAPGYAVRDLPPTAGQAGDVEVLLFDQHRAQQTGVGVDAHAEQQPAGTGLGDDRLQGQIERRFGG